MLAALGPVLPQSNERPQRRQVVEGGGRLMVGNGSLWRGHDARRAGTMVRLGRLHRVDGSVEYKEYAVDSGEMAIVVGRQMRCEYPGDKRRVRGTALTESSAGPGGGRNQRLATCRRRSSWPPVLNQTIDIPPPSAIADGLLDRTNGIESNTTLRQAMRIMAAVLAGKVSGAGSGDERFTGLDGSTLRVEVTTDPAGNRTNVNYTPN